MGSEQVEKGDFDACKNIVEGMNEKKELKLLFGWQSGTCSLFKLFGFCSVATLYQGLVA